MNPISRQNISQLFDTSQKKTFGLLALTAFITLLFFLLAIRPTLLKISEVQNEIIVNSAYQNKLQTKINTLRTLSDKLNNSQQDLDFFTKALSKDNIEQEVIANISEIVKNNNYDLLSVTTQTDKVTNTTNQVKVLGNKRFIIQFKSTNGNLQKLMEDIENYPRLLSIQKLTITNEQTYQIELLAYYLN